MTAVPAPAEVAAEYLKAWRHKDFDAIRALFADDVHVVEPLFQR